MQVWHVAFGLWAFSLFGVPRSKLVSGSLEWLVSAACGRTSKLWENASGISAEQATQRLLSATATHLLIVLAVLVAVLFLKLTFTMWLSVSVLRVEMGWRVGAHAARTCLLVQHAAQCSPALFGSLASPTCHPRRSGHAACACNSVPC